MLQIIMVVDNEEYVYGTYKVNDFHSRNAINELAMEIRDTRNVDVFVKEI